MNTDDQDDRAHSVWDEAEFDEEARPPPGRPLGVKLAVVGLVLLASAGLAAWLLLPTEPPPRATEEYIQQAQVYLDAGQVPSAVIELKNALQQDGLNVEARFLLGKLYFDYGEMVSAEKELTQARELGYPAAQLTPLLARVYMALDKNKELLALKTDELPPAALAEVLATQGLARVMAGDVEQGAALVKKAQSALPGDEYVMVTHARVLVSMRDLRGAGQQVERLLARNASNGDALILLGDIEAAEGNLDGAEAAFSRAVEAAAVPTEAQFRRAALHIRTKQFDLAQADVDQLLQRLPNNPRGHYLQGVIHFYNEDFQAAITSLLPAERYELRLPLALLYAGISHYNLGHGEQAKGYATRFHSLMPGDLLGRRLMALVHINEGEFQAAENVIRPVLEADPDDWASLTLLANALLAQGRSGEGIEILARVAELRPDSPSALSQLGAAELMRGEQAAGVAQLESALALNPELQQADILLVLNYVQQQDYEKAISAAKAYHQRNPVNPQPYNLLGRVYLVSGQSELARQAFLDALELEPGEPTASHNLAQMAINAGDYEKAKLRYEAVLAEHENYLPTLIKLAEMAARQNDFGTMVAYLQRAIERHPQQAYPRVLLARYYLGTGKPALVTGLFSGLDEAQKNQPEALIVVGLAQLAEQDYGAAKFTFQKLINSQPPSAQLHHQLAGIHAALAENRQLQQQLEKALEISPAYLPSRFMLARLYLSQGSVDRARPHLDELDQLAPGSAELLGLKAGYANLQGDVAGALVFAEKAYEQFPSSDTLLQLVAYLQQQKAFTQARQRLTQWLGSHPEDSRARLSLAYLSGLLHEDAAAIKHYQAVLEQEEDNLESLNNLAWYLRESAPKQALAYAERALELAPDSADVQDTLAIVLLNNGQLQRATKAIAAALDKNPANPTFRYHHALISARAGLRETARKGLASLLDSGASFPELEAAQALFQELQDKG